MYSFCLRNCYCLFKSSAVLRGKKYLEYRPYRLNGRVFFFALYSRSIRSQKFSRYLSTFRYVRALYRLFLLSFGRPALRFYRYFWYGFSCRPIYSRWQYYLLFTFALSSTFARTFCTSFYTLLVRFIAGTTFILGDLMGGLPPLPILPNFCEHCKGFLP